MINDYICGINDQILFYCFGGIEWMISDVLVCEWFDQVLSDGVFVFELSFKVVEELV